MSNTEDVVNTCDWCLQEARVQIIDETLWRFWKVISTEDPIITSHKSICDKCKSHYEEFFIYVERCKMNRSKIVELLSTRQVKDEPSVDIEYPPLIKREISNEVDSNFCCPVVSSGVFIEERMLEGCSNFPMKSNISPIVGVLSTEKVKKERIDIDDCLINEDHIWKEDASDPDFSTASVGKGKAELVLRVVLERLVLPDSMVLEKKVNNEHTCTYCGKSFNYPSILKLHLQNHIDDKPFECLCFNEDFNAHLNHLNAHLCIHTSDKSFKCLHCNKSFTQLGNLKAHLRIHTGDKPFKCSHCNRRFIQLGNLNAHLRIHTGDKPFKCSHCNKRFTQLSHVNAHLRIHTGDKPFTCLHCDKNFTQLSNLNAHLRLHTNGK